MEPDFWQTAFRKRAIKHISFDAHWVNNGWHWHCRVWLYDRPNPVHSKAASQENALHQAIEILDKQKEDIS